MERVVEQVVRESQEDEAQPRFCFVCPALFEKRKESTSIDERYEEQ